MRGKISFLLLCMTILFPAVSTAQFFEKQKVLVWEVFDRVNDVKVAIGTKQQIRTSIVDAFVNSRNYEAYEGNMNDINNRITAKGLGKSPANIAKTARELYEVDYVIFTTVQILERSNSYDSYKVHLASDLISTETLKSERMEYVDMMSQPEAIPGACCELLSKLLREELNVQGPQAQYTVQPSYQQQHSQQSQYTVQPSYQQQYSQQSQYAVQPSYQQPRGPQDYVETAFGLDMKMVYVEGGSFSMGATSEQQGEADSDERPVHDVQLDGFYISQFEITQAQWKAVMGTDIYNKSGGSTLYGVGSNYPMYYVSWHDAVAFCRELSVQTGKTYLLPTEAQWEYAARGGNKSRGNKYSGSYSVDAVAWYSDNSNGSTHPVGQLRANELGLHDMSGNVWEWCSDWYGSSYYSNGNRTNPTGPSSGEYRVLRGGGWYDNPAYCRVSNRNRNSPSSRDGNYGFRVVCLP